MRVGENLTQAFKKNLEINESIKSFLYFLGKNGIFSKE
jgi:hypothetical protein